MALELLGYNVKTGKWDVPTAVEKMLRLRDFPQRETKPSAKRFCRGTDGSVGTANLGMPCTYTIFNFAHSKAQMNLGTHCAVLCVPHGIT